MPEKYNFEEVEKSVLEFWDKKNIYQAQKDKNKGKKPFYFLDGPPYTSGKVHIGTAWNKSLKDMVLRYKRMKGFDVWDRAGYDMHGMPIEKATEKELGIKFKEEIPKFGVRKFVQKCRELAVRNLKSMNQDFHRLGVWMDFENAYQSITEDWIDGEWWLIKQAEKNNRLYEGEKTMTWCASCGTALSKHELEYENVSDESIFLKFRIDSKDNEYLVIWTTTPWTIPFNLGVMVNPDLEYVKVKVDEEYWIVSKGLAGAFIQAVVGKKLEIVDEFMGADLKGTRYIHPLESELDVYSDLKKKSDKVFTVVLSKEYVDLSAGTGLVHMAPGCGPEDYEVGQREGIPPFNNLEENGVFPEEMKKFAGLKAKKDDKRFTEEFERIGCLVAKTPVEHEYAHCWRCKEPVIFRTTTQWFFKIEDLKDEMRKLNKDIRWIPDYAGTRQFDSWLANLRDNGITRQRYWGTPLPIWRCEKCRETTVVGSADELRKLSGQTPEDLHIPGIDKISWRCSRCEGTMKRIPDILDVWIDAGSASWNCLYYPKRKELFEKLYPAEFIMEGIDQIRGWFNLLFVASMVSMKKPSYRNVYMHGFVHDAQGRKMSKSLGNYILPEEVISKYGADTLRYYTIGGANPGIELNYNFDDMKIKFKNLNILWNLASFIKDLARTNKLTPKEPDKKHLADEDRYILSKMNSAVQDFTKKADSYRLNELPGTAEELYLELSRTYIQLIREKSSTGSVEEKQHVLDIIFKVFMTNLLLMAPIIPFITEKIYQGLKDEFSLDTESVHLFGWPDFDKGLIDKEIEANFQTAKDVVQAILYGREKSQLGLRWPISQVYIENSDPSDLKRIEAMKESILKQTNIKKLKLTDTFRDAKAVVKIDYKALGEDFGGLVPKLIPLITSIDDSALLKAIAKDGYDLTLDQGAKVTIKKKHIMVERKVPEGIVMVESRYGDIFIDKTRTKELDSEGFAREIMRRIQTARKNKGLQKSDEIILSMSIDDDLKEMIEPWTEEICQKVGAKELIFTQELGKDIKGMTSKDRIKGKEIHYCIEDV